MRGMIVRLRIKVSVGLVSGALLVGPEAWTWTCIYVVQYVLCLLILQLELCFAFSVCLFHLYLYLYLYLHLLLSFSDSVAPFCVASTPLMAWSRHLDLFLCIHIRLGVKRSGRFLGGVVCLY
jgi:hypothetical protein